MLLLSYITFVNTTTLPCNELLIFLT